MTLQKLDEKDEASEKGEPPARNANQRLVPPRGARFRREGAAAQRARRKAGQANPFLFSSVISVSKEVSSYSELHQKRPFCGCAEGNSALLRQAVEGKASGGERNSRQGDPGFLPSLS
ncbi:MAG: hypothetical protein LBE85_01980 [Candidatus Accumulibacter sp.]|nr:hypothetical protein [Accumulibacter sp.]